MSTTVSLPEGHTAVLRDTSELTTRQRRTVQSSGFALIRLFSRIPEEDRENFDPESPEGRVKMLALFNAMEMSPSDAQVFYGIQDATIVAFLASWSRPEPLPTLENVADLPGDLYDALAEATAALGAHLMSGQAAVNFDPVPNTPENADAPFGQSETSEQPSPVQE